ncbi:MAG TPA: amidohydrolase family protein [Rhodocyclaceae bacterium]|nr:amidohydrolase family protein [Rhodocyclaceae bacterium]
MKVIDVHTHQLSHKWLELLREHGRPRFEVRKSLDAPEGIFIDGAPFMTPMPGHFSFSERVARMDEAGVDVAICSLTCPNVYWGGEAISLKAAQISNDEMAGGQVEYPSRIRWYASLPWEYPERAVAELGRACANGAVGVMVLANINNESLTAERFRPVWEAIDARALPVLVHPTAPPGAPQMDMRAYNLIASVGFMFDTSLAVARMIFDGFFDRYPQLKLIASHAGGALPYLVGRLDRCFEQMNACRVTIDRPPQDYLRRIWYDAVTYRDETLRLCLDVGGADRVMYGSDYPHNIGDMQGCLARVDRLPAAERDAVRGGTAQRIFDLGL